MYSKFETMFDRDKVNMIGKEMRIEPKFVSLINYIVVCHGVLSCKPLLALVCSDGPPRTSAAKILKGVARGYLRFDTGLKDSAIKNYLSRVTEAPKVCTSSNPLQTTRR